MFHQIELKNDKQFGAIMKQQTSLKTMLSLRAIVHPEIFPGNIQPFEWKFCSYEKPDLGSAPKWLLFPHEGVRVPLLKTNVFTYETLTWMIYYLISNLPSLWTPYDASSSRYAKKSGFSFHWSIHWKRKQQKQWIQKLKFRNLWLQTAGYLSAVFSKCSVNTVFKHWDCHWQKKPMSLRSSGAGPKHETTPFSLARVNNIT